MPEKMNLAETFQQIDEDCKPHIVDELNRRRVKLVKLNVRNERRKETSYARQKLLWHLKYMGEVDVEDLAVASGISRSDIQNHLATLEEIGLVEHSEQKEEAGRPTLIYRLSDRSKIVFLL